MVQEANATNNLSNLLHLSFEVGRITDDSLASGNLSLGHNTSNTASGFIEGEAFNRLVKHVCTTIDGRQTGKTLRQISKTVDGVQIRRLSVVSQRIHVELSLGDGLPGRFIQPSFVTVEAQGVANNILGGIIKRVLLYQAAGVGRGVKS